MDVDPTELIPTIPPAPPPIVTVRPAMSAPPVFPTARPAIAAAPPAKVTARPANVAAPPAKVTARPATVDLELNLEIDEMLAVPAKARPPGPPPKPKPKLNSPNKPSLAEPHAADFGSFALQVPPPAPSLTSPFAIGTANPLSPMTAAAMLDFTRDVSTSTLAPRSPFASEFLKRIRAHTKWLALAGGTLLIGVASWGAFRLASTEPSLESIGGGPSATPLNTLASAAVMPAPSRPPVAPPAAEPVEPAAPVVAAANENPTAADPAPPAPTEPSTEVAAPAPVAIAPTTAPTTAPSTARPTSAIEQPSPPVAAEPVARNTAAETRQRPSSVERGSQHPPETVPEAPAAKSPPAPEPSPVVTASSPDGFDATPNFDQTAAMQALRQATDAASRCRTTDTPPGGVRVAVTFARSGQVTSADVDGPAAGTPLGECVAGKFRSVRVPAFKGSVMTVRKTVMF